MMVSMAILQYLEFVHRPIGGIVVVVLSVVACAAIVLWVMRRAREERLPVLVASSFLSGVVIGVYGAAVASGWWHGAYFETPLVVQAATLLPLSIAGWLAWLLGYGWVAAHSRHPLLVYLLVGLLLTVIVVVADGAELTGGLILIAEDGQTWHNALVALGFMFVPILMFEGIRNVLARDALP